MKAAFISWLPINFGSPSVVYLGKKLNKKKLGRVELSRIFMPRFHETGCRVIKHGSGIKLAT
jgi:hypothetical protein